MQAPTDHAELASSVLLTRSVGLSDGAVIGVLTLNRPDNMNSLSRELIDAIHDALITFGQDPATRALVLTGAGERAFCAGIDVNEVASRDADADTAPEDPLHRGFEFLHHTLGGIIRRIHRLDIPVISAVNGHAVGAGFAIAAACDARVGSPAATFRNGFIRRGLSGAEMGLSYFLPRLVAPGVAYEWMMTGRAVGAPEALDRGLLQRLSDDDDVVDVAIELAATMAQHAPMAVAMTKEVFWANLEAPSLDAALALESRTQSLTRLSADAAEARQSFLERREPVFAPRRSPRPLR